MKKSLSATKGDVEKGQEEKEDDDDRKGILNMGKCIQGKGEIGGQATRAKARFKRAPRVLIKYTDENIDRQNYIKT